MKNVLLYPVMKTLETSLTLYFLLAFLRIIYRSVMCGGNFVDALVDSIPPIHLKYVLFILTPPIL